MSKKERILINEDLQKAQQIVRHLETKSIKEHNFLKQCYEAFELENPFSEATLQDAYFNNGNFTIEHYRKFVTDSLKPMPAVLSKSVMKDAEELIKLYSGAVSNLHKGINVSGSNIGISHFSYDEVNGFYIKEERKEQLTENYCRYYVEGETANLFYDHIVGVQKAMKKGEKLFNDCKQSKGLELQSIPQYLNMFFDRDLNITNYVCSATDKLNK